MNETKSLKAMANETRRELMRLLSEGERTVNELVRQFDVARPAISRHLRVLREAGLIDYRADHNVRYYRLRQPEIERLRDRFQEEFAVYWTPQGGNEVQSDSSEVVIHQNIVYEARIEVVLRTDIHTAYGFWTDPDLFRSWVGADGINENRVGGKFAATSAFGGRLEGEHLALAPPNLVVDRITSPIDADKNFYMTRFIQDGEAVHVVKSHYVQDRDLVPLLTSAWGRTLEILKDKLTSGS